MDIQPWERMLWSVAKFARLHDSPAPPDYTFSFARQRPMHMEGLVSKDMRIVPARPIGYYARFGCRLDDPDQLYRDDEAELQNVFPDDMMEDDPAFAIRRVK
jgi:hypothetical protein